jgi:hypothetical protein
VPPSFLLPPSSSLLPSFLPSCKGMLRRRTCRRRTPVRRLGGNGGDRTSA